MTGKTTRPVKHRRQALLNILRTATGLTTAKSMAEVLGRSERNMWRDIAALRAQGHKILGERGAGYLYWRGPE